MTVPRRLVEESELFEKLVDDAKRREPPPEALQGLLEKLGSRPAAPAGVTSRRWGWTALAGVGCLALLGAALGRWQAHDRPSEMPSSTKETPPEVTAASPSIAASSMQPVPSLSINDLPDSKAVASPPRTRLAPPPSAPASAARPASAHPKPSVGREIELIARAREALTKGDGRACLAAVDLHDSEFPAGQFVLEAQVMRIEATLANGDRDGARSLARDYLAKNPASPYETRIRSLLSEAESR